MKAVKSTDQDAVCGSVAEHRRDMSDEALLLDYIATRDSRSFAELVRRYDRPLNDYLRRCFGDAELASDAVQGAWMQLHLKCHTFQSDRRLRPWLYTVAVNQAIDAVRTRRRQRMHSIEYGADDSQEAGGGELRGRLPSDTASSVDLVQWSESRAQVRRAVGQLPPHQRQLVRLVFFDGLKYREAAQQLEIPEGTAKSRMHAAFGRLQEQLVELAS